MIAFDLVPLRFRSITQRGKADDFGTISLGALMNMIAKHTSISLLAVRCHGVTKAKPTHPVVTSSNNSQIVVWLSPASYQHVPGGTRPAHEFPQ